ncbi:MAG: acetolactate synthase small subunit [Chloroflexi bacterium]|nr:acetolactate synthase small subunit [Chloroflexota bacterium]MCH7642700.1 acetolactate synthase small subunit [Chloroflexota bacterium]
MANGLARRTLVALVENKPGVLARIAMLFRRRGLNIASLAVGSSEQSDLSRMTFVVEGDPTTVGHIAKHLDKLIDVVDVADISDANVVWRELAMVRVRATQESRPRVIQLANIFRVSIVDVGAEAVTMEITGDTAKIDSMITLMEEFGVEQVMRTGRVAMLRSALSPGGQDGEFGAQITSNVPVRDGLESGSV